ncbi:TaqI-like C-terminal specificity domain-containing protein [uncultured Brachyspira sp.]|uniref:type IIG restriction enzyme/methyltransferase n=2 Tax=uncultured Brachyspira sp. TaxID=221953 RepID=UPI0025FCD7FB|nr:TaqI-like C-terminal specificity domain-containing protein [uncultured Brachyspira sp.]
MKSITKNAKELLKLRNLLNYEIDNDKLDFFKRDIQWYRNEINNAKNKGETEEHCKGILNKFLVDAFGYNCNTSGKIDLVIKFDDNIKTIIEAKNYNNTLEMIEDNNYNNKAFYQTILYYYKSRKNKDNKDFNIDNIIITNFEKVYLFSKYDFEKLINDNQIANYFNENGKVKNETFYKICGGFLENINLEVIGYRLDLFNDDLETIYRFFNRYNICSVKLENDINSISNTFYKEIIYMMGLEEDKDKKLRLSNTHNSLIRLTMDIVRDNFDNENEIFEEALKLNIIWVNRILFLKILEAQLRIFRNDSNLDILNPFKIKDYNYLYTLFFNVLAKPKNMRHSDKIYKYIPYLNSSLFEEGKDEIIFSITKLNNNSKMKIMSSSILYNDRDFNLNQLTFLEYILRFLNCYIFNADVKNADKNTIIKSSVLGLVFERLNGYKDGSHFTPPAITMYMAKKSIEKIIIEKFNKFFTETHFNNIDEVKNYVRANIHIYKERVKDILNSIKIIDPACGSGHFLAACLNELIRIKSEFRVLHEMIDIDIFQDELVINYIDGTHFKYNIENDNITERKQDIQKTLFEAKEYIISNQLYGVDINPNSVNICRLRLWIELLKSSYYTDIKSNEKFIDLEILPNLEFKIVSANSLIELDETEVNLISLTWDKNELVKNMNKYFNASYENKKNIRKEILRLIKEYSHNNTKLENYNPFDMLKSYDFFDSGLMFGIDKFDLVIGNPPYGIKISKDLRMIYEKCHGKVPDVQIQYWFMILAKKIVSEDGFISYIIPNSIMFNVFAESFRKKLLDDKNIVSLIDCSNFDVFEHAIVRNVIITMSLKNNNKIEYIPSQNINDINTLLKQKLQLLDIKMLYAFIRNWSLIYLKSKENLNIVQKIVSSNTVELEHYYKELVSQGLIAYDKYRGQSEQTIKSRKFHSYKKINDDYKKWLYGEDVTPYSVKWNEKEYFNYCDEVANPRKPFFFNSRRILIREITNPKIYAAYTDEEMYNDPSLIIIVENKDNPKHLLFLLGLLNSKLMTFYHFNSSPKASKGIFPKLLIDDVKKLPIVKTDYKTIDKVCKLVLDIIDLKKENKDISKLEIKIDKIFYKLYNLSDDDIRIIERDK